MKGAKNAVKAQGDYYLGTLAVKEVIKTERVNEVGKHSEMQGQNRTGGELNISGKIKTTITNDLTVLEVMERLREI